MDKIFCVEDDPNIRELVEYTLSSVGFEVEGFESGYEFLSRIKDQKPDLVLLDIMLPGMDGTEVLKTLRQTPETENLCVIFLTAKSEQMDKIKGLDMGADDYISKPFDILELISRVKAVLRRAKITVSKQTMLAYKDISIDEGKRAVFAGGDELRLTYKEYELLLVLLKNQSKVVTREEIIAEVWGTDFEGESRTLDVHIRTLRHKLGDRGNYIETVRNVGYKVGD